MPNLGFLHWVQTKAPAEGDRLGAPELSLQPDIMDTTDGVAKFPYIRGARRIKALRTIVEQDVSAHFQNGPTAARFGDSVGVGWYPINIHRAGAEDVSISCRTRPFQIPLGALIPVPLRNLIAAKNIGTTHTTNGCTACTPSNGTLAKRQARWRPSASARARPQPSSKEIQSYARLSSAAWSQRACRWIG